MRLSKHKDSENKMKEEMEGNSSNNNTAKVVKVKKKVTADVESVARDDRRKIPRRNSWAEIYYNNTVRRKSLKLLGEAVVIDNWLDWRVKWGQHGIGFFIMTGMICFILAGETNVGLRIAVVVIFVIVLIFAVILLPLV